MRNAIFVLPHHEHVPRFMSDLERFLHAEDIDAHPLLRIAIALYQFETIHPFLDGNGRLGCLMISFYLASKGLLTQPSLYLSNYFERNKTAYIDHLMAVRQGNHLPDWVVFFLHGVEAHALMLNLNARPVTSVGSASRVTGLSTNAASSLIADLVSFGVLTEVTGQRRNRLFGFDDDLKLFGPT